MASTCYSLLRVPAVRVTKLDSCGNVVDGNSSVASDGVITIEQTVEQEDRQDFFTLNADGQPCVRDTSPPIFKWINVTLTFCQVDPEMYNIMTAEPLVLSDSASPSAVGFRTREGSVNDSNFAFESWMRVSGDSNCAGGVNYGYFLLPWVKEAVVGDMTMQNGLANFTVTGRTSYNSPWGTGPYNIRKVESGADEGAPAKLLTAITSLDHRHMQLTTLAPPTATCGATSVNGTLTVIDPGVGTTAELTIPDNLTLPAIVEWGDATANTTVAAGASSPVTHTYAAPGTYTVTMYSSAVSGPIWTGQVTVS